MIYNWMSPSCEGLQEEASRLYIRVFTGVVKSFANAVPSCFFRCSMCDKRWALSRMAWGALSTRACPASILRMWAQMEVVVRSRSGYLNPLFWEVNWACRRSTLCLTGCWCVCQTKFPEKLLGNWKWLISVANLGCRGPVSNIFVCVYLYCI